MERLAAHQGDQPDTGDNQPDRDRRQRSCRGRWFGTSREAGCHPSTILRQVRKLETLRDDPLVDRALSLIEEMPERAEHT